MPIWLSTILEIIKITAPALIVFLTVYYLVKTYLDKKYQIEVLKLKQSQQNLTIPMRMQAYERLSLLCERISIPNLVFRLRQEDQSAAMFRISLLLAVQQEFEYNITQQVYVSEQLWQILKISRDNVVSIINAVAEKIDPQAPSKDLANLLLTFSDKQPNSSLETALAAIKKEASIIL